MALGNILTDLGYGDFSNGVCFGVAHSAKQAILMGKADDFNALLAICNKHSSQKIKQLITNALNSDIETLVIKQYKQLPDFLRGISLYQGPKQHSIKLGEVSTWYHQDALYTEKNLLPQALRVEGELASKCFSGIYTPDELRSYFWGLQQHLEGAEYPVVIVMESYNHTLVTGYLPKEKRWIFFNESRFGRKFTDAVQVAELVVPAFLNNATSLGLTSSTVAFSSELYALNIHEKSFNRRINDWMKTQDWLSIHTHSPEKIQLTDSNGISWIWMATKKGLVDSVYNLVRAGADPRKSCGNDDISPLGVAARTGHVEITKILMNYVSPNETFSSRKLTPLHLAVSRMQIPPVQVLLDGGADPNIADADGYTPLRIAAQLGGVDVLKTLIENRATLDYSLIISCVLKGYDKALECFLKMNLGVTTAPIQINTDCLNILFSASFCQTEAIQRRKRLFMETQTNSIFHITPYQIACIAGKGVIISSFINSGAVPNPVNNPIYQRLQCVIKKLESAMQSMVGSSIHAAQELNAAKDLRFLYLCFGTVNSNQMRKSIEYDSLADIFKDALPEATPTYSSTSSSSFGAGFSHSLFYTDGHNEDIRSKEPDTPELALKSSFSPF